MSIKDSIDRLNTCLTDLREDKFLDATAQAVKVAIKTMEKYQKIEEIVENYGFDTSWLCLKKIGEVIDDDSN